MVNLIINYNFNSTRFPLRKFCKRAIVTEVLKNKDHAEEEEVVAKPFESIPGPRILPIIGAAWKYLPYIGSYHLSQPMQDAALRYKEYGPIVREKIFGSNVIFLYDVDDIEKIMRYSGKYPERRSHTTLAHFRRSNPNKYNSTGLLPSNGIEWWKLRTVSQKIMYNMKIIKSFISCTDDVSKQFTNRIERIYCSKGGIVTPDFYQDLIRFNMKLLWLMLFGQNLDCFSPEEMRPDSLSSEIITATEETFQNIIFHDSIGIKLAKLLPSYEKFLNASKKIDQLASDHIVKKVNDFAKNEQKENTILDLFMAVPNIQEGDILPLLIDLILGGVDTTSITTSFALFHLSKNEQVQEKLAAEAQLLLPSKESCITEETLSNAYYLKAFVKEVLRINPISVGIGRQTTDDIVLGGYHIPKGVVIVTMNQFASTSPKNFKNPNIFLPERWLRGDELHENVHPFASIPFGNGTRMCIARRMAEQNMYISILRMVRNFKISWVGEDLQVNSRLLNYPGGPVKLSFKMRH